MSSMLSLMGPLLSLPASEPPCFPFSCKPQIFEWKYSVRGKRISETPSLGHEVKSEITIGKQNYLLVDTSDKSVTDCLPRGNICPTRKNI